MAPAVIPFDRQRPEAGDRRRDRRYQIEAELEYRLLRNGKLVEAGRGQSINVSSSGLLFASAHDVPVGLRVEISLMWPVMLSDSIPLKLCIWGRIVRSHAGRVAISIRRHMFR